MTYISADGWLPQTREEHLGRSSDAGSQEDAVFAQTFRPIIADNVHSEKSHLIEDAEFHRRYVRGAGRRQVVSEAIDALSLGIVPLYRAAKREWNRDAVELHMGSPIPPSAFHRVVHTIKRGVQLIGGGGYRDDAREDPFEPAVDSVAYRVLARPKGASLERLVESGPGASPTTISYDPASIGEAYVSETLAGRTLNSSAMRAVEAKRSRLETFAQTYAQTGSVGEAVVAVGITSERTIDDYLRRTGIPANSGNASDRSEPSAEQERAAEDANTTKQ